MSKQIIPGFSNQFEERLRKAQMAQAMKDTSPIPLRMQAGIAAVINAAMNGKVAQMELAAGMSQDNYKKVRMVVLPDGHGEVIEDENGQKLRLFAVPEELGAIVKVGDGPKPVKEEEVCGSQEKP